MTTPILTEAEMPALPEAATCALIQGIQGSEYRSLSPEFAPGCATYSPEQCNAYGRAVEAAVLTKLAAMNEPERCEHLRPIDKVCAPCGRYPNRTPPVQPEKDERKPLAAAQIADGRRRHSGSFAGIPAFVAGVRFAERAHGIGSSTEGGGT